MAPRRLATVGDMGMVAIGNAALCWRISRHEADIGDAKFVL